MKNLLLILALCLGCGAQSKIRSAAVHTARLSLVETDQMRLAFYESRDEHCREEFPPAEHHAFDTWRECMTPAYRLKTAVESADHAFRALDAALEASDKDSIFRALGPALEAVSELVYTLTSAGLRIPAELEKAIELLRSLSRFL